MKTYLQIILVLAATLYGYLSQIRLSANLEEAKDFLKSHDTFTITIVEILQHSPTSLFCIAKIHSLNASILAKIPDQNLTIGDTLEIRGKSSFDLNPQFSNYYKLKHIAASVEISDIYSLKQQVSVYGFFYGSRRYLSQSLQSQLDFQSSSFLAGIILGDTDLLSGIIKEDFKRAGLSHVMAVSGANMSLLAQVIAIFLCFLPIRMRYVVTAITIVLFCGLVGMSAAVLRAGIMAFLASIAVISGQKYWGSRAFILVLMLFFVFDPTIVFYDVGLQLSSSATAGLLFLNPIILRILQFVRIALLRELVSTTFSASLATLPIVLYYFGEWSPLSIVINILIVPFISILSMVLYAVFILLYVPFINTILAHIINLLIFGLLSVIHFCAQISSTLVFTWKMPVWGLFLYYFLLTLLMGHFNGGGIISRVKK